jgi:hypothetical protein|tara:strand:- start:1211 stop:1786 length:576 start_codon:yes stop_codon:yes gene_type:complete
MSKAVRKTARQYITAFEKVFAKALEGFVEAAKIYVEAIEANPANAQQFKAHFADSIPSRAWGDFEAVGRGWKHPRLVMGTGGRYAHKIARLPMSQQERVFKRGLFDVVTPKGKVKQVEIMEATPEQVEQILDGGHVRDVSEQKAYVEAKAVSGPTAELMPYTIYKGRVTFRRGVTMTIAEVKRLEEELAGE